MCPSWSCLKTISQTSSFCFCMFPICIGYKPSWVLFVSLQQENKGLREILQITRESFLNLRKDDASESTSLSALVTNSDLSLRKSWVAFCVVTRTDGPRSEWMSEHKTQLQSAFSSSMYRDTGKETAAECLTSGPALDPSHSQKGEAEPEWSESAGCCGIRQFQTCCWLLGWYRITLNASNKCGFLNGRLCSKSSPSCAVSELTWLLYIQLLCRRSPVHLPMCSVLIKGRSCLKAIGMPLASQTEGYTYT